MIVMERINARSVEKLPEPIDLATIDASFISLKILLPVVKGWFSSRGGQVLALIKPQFEAGRAEANRGSGVIRDPEVHRRILWDLLNFAQREGFSIKGLIRSPLLGPKGNVEFLVHLEFPGETRSDLETLINSEVTIPEQQ